MGEFCRLLLTFANNGLDPDQDQHTLIAFLKLILEKSTYYKKHKQDGSMTLDRSPESWHMRTAAKEIGFKDISIFGSSSHVVHPR